MAMENTKQGEELQQRDPQTGDEGPRGQSGNKIRVNNIRSSASELSEFTQLLLQRQNEVLGREQEARSHLDEQVVTDPGDVGDVSVVDTSADYYLRLANHVQRELLEIRDALDRLHRGVYGICESCEEIISKDRLKRLPYARLCIDCQSNLEKKRRAS